MSIEKYDWEDPKLLQPDFETWTPLTDGTPEYFKILNWKDKVMKQFGDRTSQFIETDLGFLRTDSIRLRKQLSQFVGFKGLIVMQRWVDKENTRNTKYLLQKNSEAGELSQKIQTKLPES